MLQVLKRMYKALPIPLGVRTRIGRLLYPLRSQRARLGRTQVPPGGTLQAGVRLQLQPAGVRDYVFYGVIDWHFRHQRPQQIATAIARQGHRVFYISVNFVADKEPGYALERIDPALPIFQVFLHSPVPITIYTAVPTAQLLSPLRAGIRKLWLTEGIHSACNVIQHPFWHALGAFLPAARTVYDCMDHHAGFSNTGEELETLEERLMRSADITVVTSDALDHYARPRTRRVAMVRNAGEYDHFHQAVAMREALPSQPKRKPVIGYYGAIAEWFDADLLDELARRFADCEFFLIGDDSAGVGDRLKQHRHVRLLGEKPYAELPQWLAQFDVCLIPFKINPLTLATNPVKVYEYLSAGKPVVSTDLPELQQFGELVYRAVGADAFADAIARSLAEAESADGESLRSRRLEYAAHQTWAHRAQDFMRAAEHCADEPRVSVVVVAYNQWQLTERCLASLEAHADGVPMQIIVVDNASSDETATRLLDWQKHDSVNRYLVLNKTNLGFAGGVNSGLSWADGDYLVILNNDTIVSQGWARGLRRHFERDPGLGLICPVTNNIGNEAQIALAGTTPAEVFESAKRYSLDRTGEILELDNVAFFCVMMPRIVWESTGGLDERFFPGFYEDDDYCKRVLNHGWKIGCAEDVFVYHELSASFNAEGQARRHELLEKNRKLFEEKWGPWTPHRYRRESLHP